MTAPIGAPQVGGGSSTEIAVARRTRRLAVCGLTRRILWSQRRTCRVVLNIEQRTSDGRSDDLTRYWTDCDETVTVPPERFIKNIGAGLTSQLHRYTAQLRRRPK